MSAPASDAAVQTGDKTSLLERLLIAADIHPRIYIALVRAFLLMDFRSQHFERATASKPKDKFSPLFWVIGQYLLIGGFLSVALFARVEAWFFVFAAISVSVVAIGSSIIVEFNEVVIDAGDLDIIGHQPVPVRTYAAARMTNLLAYVLVMTAALNLFPAIVGTGLRDTIGWTYFPAYIITSLLANLATAAGLILLYTLFMGGRPSEESREVLAWTQIVLMAGIFYGGQMVLRDAKDRLEMAAYNLPEWIQFIPTAWLANFVNSVGPASSLGQWWILALLILVTGGLWAAAIWRLSAAYASMEPGGKVGWQRSTHKLATPGDIATPVSRWFSASRDEIAGYWLCATMMQRDADLKMRSWPAFGMMAAALAFGLYTSQFTNPLRVHGTTSILSIVSLYMLALPIPTILNNLNFSRDHAAAWVLWTAPVSDSNRFCNGVMKALTLRILLPIAVVLFAICAYAWQSIPDALAHVVAGWLVVLGVGHVSKAAVLRGFPFSEPLSRGDTMGQIAVFSAIIGAAVMALVTAHYFAARAPLTYGLYIGGLFVIVQVLRVLSARSIVRRGNRKLFYDER